MTSKKFQLDNYKSFLLNRNCCSPNLTEYIENCLATEVESANHTFHKIMIHNWTETMEQAYDAFNDYYGTVLIPVNGYNLKKIAIFYTSNLYLILKIIKFDFIFPFCRNMFNVDVLFNDKSSLDFFGSNVTIEEIVSSVVSNRFSEDFELDLSDFSNDREFVDKKIHFYKVNLLTQYKILMLRMGKDTKLLNLSNNNLCQPPLDILNFFIKGDLIAINLSNNNIPSVSDLLRVSSKIERLWVEGNPLCEDIDEVSYVKNILLKFPRLTELDGIQIKQHGIMFPFYKNFIETSDKKTKMIVEKFLTLYFSHYDGTSGSRSSINMFYHPNATLSFNTTLQGSHRSLPRHIALHTREICNCNTKEREKIYKMRLFKGRAVISQVLNKFPVTVHDPTTFTVDVLKHDKKCLILVVEGIYKEIDKNVKTHQLFQFRRTFVFTVNSDITNTLYHIVNEIYTISFATTEQRANSFKFQYPMRNLNSLSLVNPDESDVESITNLFSQITNLKTSEALLRLKSENWNIKDALVKFTSDLRAGQIPQEKFKEDDDFSDTSSLMDDID